MKVLHSICQQIWKTQQWPQDWKRSVFIPIPKKGNAKECSNYLTIALISHASKVMLKILQARLQQYVNHELPDVQAGFRKGKEPEIKLPTSAGSWIKQESSRKTSVSTLLTMPKSLTVWITTNWKILRDRNTRPPYLPPEKSVCRSRSNRTRHQTVNISRIIEKAREFQKNIYFCFLDYAKAFGCVDHNKLWKNLQEMEYQTT